MADQATETTEAAPVEGEAAPAEDATEAPAATEETTTDAPAEGEAVAAEGEKAEEKPAEPAIPEEALKAAAEKYAAEKVKSANRTMAAARRSEARTEAIKSENERLKTDNGHYRAFVDDLRGPNVHQALRAAGFPTVRAFLEHVRDQGAEPAAPTAEDRAAALEKRWQEREERERREAAERADADSKAKVATAIKADGERWDLAATDEGQGRLWACIDAYRKQYGNVPDQAVFMMADGVEKEMLDEYEARIASSRKLSSRFSPRTAANSARPAAGSAASAASKGGAKTLTNRATTGAPATREYDSDPDVRRRQIEEELRAEGILAASA